MNDSRPDVPPEVPPPWRPDDPSREPAPGPGPSPPIPTVPVPGSETPGHDRGEDALERLLAHRTVVVNGVLTDQVATRAAAQLMALNAEGDDAVTLHLNCRSGDLDAALALADTVALMTVEVIAHCRGKLGGPALAVFAAADRRVCSAHATLRFRDPQVSVSGRAGELETEARALRAQVDRLITVIAEASRQSRERVADDMRTGRVLDAEQAVAYGLADEIAYPASLASSDPDRSQE